MWDYIIPDKCSEFIGVLGDSEYNKYCIDKTIYIGCVVDIMKKPNVDCPICEKSLLFSPSDYDAYLCTKCRELCHIDCGGWHEDWHEEIFTCDRCGTI